MVSSRPAPSMEFGNDYIYVDWGAEFFAQHSLAFPQYTGAALTVNIGWLGLPVRTARRPLVPAPM